MATAMQGDPRDALLQHFVKQVRLTDDANKHLVNLLQNVDPNSLHSATDEARARASMDQLAQRLLSKRSFDSVIDVTTLKLALKDLCPLFPIC